MRIAGLYTTDNGTVVKNPATYEKRDCLLNESTNQIFAACHFIDQTSTSISIELTVISLHSVDHYCQR